jgi:response regulator RpfG family c-di-GMP phosphodiesterase
MCRCQFFNRASQSYHRAKHRILYAGQDLELLASLREMVKDCYIVRSPSGGVARGLLRSEIEYALLLVDEELPDMSGQAVGVLARELKRREEMPIIILTGVESRDSGARVFCKRQDEAESVARMIMRLLAPPKSNARRLSHEKRLL